MGDTTVITADMVLKATEKDLDREHVEMTFWGPLTQAHTDEMPYGKSAPPALVSKKTQVKDGEEYCDFGMALELSGEGTFQETDQLTGREEPLISYSNRAYFGEVRHAVPFNLKGLKYWKTKPFKQLQKPQRALSVWNGRIHETWAWESLFKGVPDEIATAHGSNVAQTWHPNWYSVDASGEPTLIPWSATVATHAGNIDDRLFALSAGKVINEDTIDAVEVLLDDLKVPMVSVDGQECWLWAYPRASRRRLKGILRDKFLAGDVRGMKNRALAGNIFRYSKFCFVETNYLPRISPDGAGNLTLQGAWEYSAATNKRADARTASILNHAIMGADTLCLAEPEKLQYDMDHFDYKRKKGVASYCLKGFVRNEYHDQVAIASRTATINQASLILSEHLND